MHILPPLIHGTLRERYILLFGMAGSFAMVAGFVGAWIGARLAGRDAIPGSSGRQEQSAITPH